MMEGAVVKLAVPVVFGDVRRTELIPESENAVRTRLSGIKVILGTFEGSKLVDGKVLWELFDREAGKIVRHSMCLWAVGCAPFNSFAFTAD